MKRPCLTCGEPTKGSHCDEHKPRQHVDNRERPPERRTARWARLSQRLRKAQPFCLTCGTRDDLTVDHIIPVSVRPDLAFDLDNLAVLCRSHNSRKGATVTERDQTRGVTPTEGHASPRRQGARTITHPPGVCVGTERDA